MTTATLPLRRVTNLTAKLDNLLADDTDGFHVSIYQAAGRLPDEAETARTQLRSHLREIRHQLSEAGAEESEAEKLMAPIVALDDDDEFWNHQQGGLAVYVSSSRTEIISVAHPFQNAALVTGRFHLKPLMALAANVDAYHLLSLSQKEVKLYRGSALGIREVEVPNLPSSYEDAMDKLGFQPDSFAASAAKSNLKVDDEHLKKFFREVDAAVTAYLSGMEWPLIIAGVDYYHSLYREKNNYRHLTEAYISGNPEHRELEELHEEASRLLKSEFIESQKRAMIQVAKVEKPENVVTQLKEVLSSAQAGRVKTLIVPHDAQQWGNFSLDDQSLDTADSPSAKTVDLYETAARLALNNGAEVFFVQANQIPNQADLIANLRW